ncbi:MAG: sodium:proton antiporter [Candidatus Margulisbacteria bacterium]|nr:sodium:proton antiporter [Candidatus Margulisiibacteriota bacterium]
MQEHLLLGFSSILVLGIGAQWISWRLKFPSIIILLLTGFIAGPITGFVDPDLIFGELLFPVISLSVAIILFEGGLNLKIPDLKNVWIVVRNKVTIGALVTWILVSTASIVLLGLDPELSILLGAILIVTGPTVIMPLLRHVRVNKNVSSILMWEGIVIDPIGATAAVLVFEIIIAGGLDAIGITGLVIIKTILVGCILGVLASVTIIVLLKRSLVPDFLQETVTLMMVVMVYVLSNLVQSEAGLLTVTIMGIVLANQKTVNIKHIAVFKENLQIMLISTLFIILGARLPLEDILQILSLPFYLFLIFLVVVVRPVGVFVSTIGTNLTINEKLFLSCMAPRGIVAAAVASLFGLELVKHGFPEASQLVPITFGVIFFTVSFYGIMAVPIAKLLRVYVPRPQGILFVGAHSWAREMAKALQENGIQVMMVDTNKTNIIASKSEGLPTANTSALSSALLEEAELGGFGRLVSLTSSDEVNLLAAIQFTELFGTPKVYRLSPENTSSKEELKQHRPGRFLFGKGMTYTYLSARFIGGATIQSITITETLDMDVFKEQYKNRAIPLFLVTEDLKIRVFAQDRSIIPKPGQRIICLVDPSDQTS